ncbi:MAG: hypothetical protein IPI60_03495 [Saprospiraceae bacterium]|nr:hypothetical protein [Saprospiraceae bacterium]
MRKVGNPWLLELVWWIFTAVLVIFVLYPIYQQIPEYPFWTMNCIAIATFITSARLIFFLRFSPIAYIQPLKVVLAIAMIPFIFILVSQFNFFQTYLDENGILSFLGHLSPPRIDSMDKYIRNEIGFFSIGAIISSAILAIRLIISVWRVRNKGTV